jgi:hypothetical protein
LKTKTLYYPCSYGPYDEHVTSLQPHDRILNPRDEEILPLTLNSLVETSGLTCLQIRVLFSPLLLSFPFFTFSNKWKLPNLISLRSIYIRANTHIKLFFTKYYPFTFSLPHLFKSYFTHSQPFTYFCFEFLPSPRLTP